MAERGVFFIHVMKAGGTSFNHALAEHFPPEARYPTDSMRAPAIAKVDMAGLVALDAETMRRTRFFSVHMLAAISELLDLSDLLRVTVLRDPVERTISHLHHIISRQDRHDDVLALYRDETWRSRLTNYQTQIFADPVPMRDEQATEEDKTFRLPKGIDPERMKPRLLTAIARPHAVDEDDLRSAIRRLDAFDVVGVTTQLDPTLHHVLGLLGRDHPMVLRLNRRNEEHEVSPELRRLIEADTQLDRALYDHARRLTPAAVRS